MAFHKDIAYHMNDTKNYKGDDIIVWEDTPSWLREARVVPAQPDAIEPIVEEMI
jgi:hypothetical protein